MVKFFHLVVNSGLLYNIDNFISLWKVRHSQTGIIIDFWVSELQLQLYMEPKTQGNILLLINVEVWIEYPEQNMESLRTPEHE